MTNSTVIQGAMSARGERFIALDSLRGLAAVAVLFYHMGDFGAVAGLPVFRHSWLLVDFFFVLSGFVIAASYGDRLREGFSRGRFMKLRLGRVVPLHLAIAGLFIAAEFLVFRPFLNEPHETWLLWRGLFLLDGFATTPGNFFAPVSWSISVEIMLYLAAALLFGAGRWGMAVAVVAAGAAIWALAVDWNEPGFGYLLQRGTLGFTLGVGAHFAHRKVTARLPSGVLTGAEIAVVAAALWLIPNHWGHSTVIPADVLFALAVWVFARDGGLLSKALQTRPMVELGRLSYSIYMVHMLFIIGLNRALPPLFEAIGRSDWIAGSPLLFGLLSVDLGPFGNTLLSLGVVGAVIATSVLSYRWIEEPARQWSRNLRLKRGGAFQPTETVLSASA